MPPKTQQRRQSDPILQDILDAVQGGGACSKHLAAVTEVSKIVTALDSKVTKINGVRDVVQGHHKTLYADDGRGGVVGDVQTIGSDLVIMKRLIYMMLGSTMALGFAVLLQFVKG